MREGFLVNSESSKAAYHAQIDDDFEKEKYLTYPPPRKGKDRSIDQNSLFHLFCSMWIAHKLGKHYKQVEKFEMAGMKRTVKKLYYIAHPEAHWMLQVITDYTTGERRKDYTSSKDWLAGEMFQVLEFMQNVAAEQGLILESRGEFNRLQQKQRK